MKNDGGGIFILYSDHLAEIEKLQADLAASKKAKDEYYKRLCRVVDERDNAQLDLAASKKDVEIFKNSLEHSTINLKAQIKELYDKLIANQERVKELTNIIENGCQNEFAACPFIADKRSLELRVKELESKYSELIMEVQQKHPDESRHETARRYIHEREHRENSVAREALGVK
jgi:hypothetical protein